MASESRSRGRLPATSAAERLSQTIQLGHLPPRGDQFDEAVNNLKFVCERILILPRAAPSDLLSRSNFAIGCNKPLTVDAQRMPTSANSL